jgi:hypothetical protein
MIIKSVPLTNSSLYSNLIWVVYDANSLNSSYKSYQYLADIYINGVKVCTAKIYPNVNNGNLGIFNLGRDIRQYVSAAFKDMQSFGEYAALVQVKFGEYYNGAKSNVEVADTERIFKNYYLDRSDKYNQIITNINFPATTRPDKTVFIFQDTAKFYIPITTGLDSSKTYQVSTIVNGVTTFRYNYFVEGSAMARFNIAGFNINEDYQVKIVESGTGTTKYINVVVECYSMYNKYVLHFLNKFGGFESYSFYRLGKRTLDITDNTYKSLGYMVNSTTGAVSYKDSDSNGYRQTTKYSVSQKESIKLGTDFLTDAEYEWLRQLMVSPLIYLQDGDTAYPVTITDKKYEFKQVSTDKLTKLDINLAFSDTFYSQNIGEANYPTSGGSPAL